MERRALLALLVAALGVGGLFYLATPKKAPGSAFSPTQVVFPPGMDVQGKGMRLLRTSSKGDTRITAQAGYGERDSSEGVLEQVAVEFTDPEGQARTLSADRGVLRDGSRMIELQGNVRATSSGGYELRTGQVNLDLVDHVAETRAPVSLVGPGITLSGRGATLNWAKNTVEIRGKVSAVLSPDDMSPETGQLLPGARRRN